MRICQDRVGVPTDPLLCFVTDTVTALTIVYSMEFRKPMSKHNSDACPQGHRRRWVEGEGHAKGYHRCCIATASLMIQQK